MAIKLPESARKVLQDKAYGHVVTFSADGRAQVTLDMKFWFEQAKMEIREQSSPGGQT